MNDPCYIITFCFIGLRDSGIDASHLCFPWRLVEFEVNMNDQTAKADAGKPRVSLVPSAIVYAIAKVREYGCNRYPEGGKNNWKRVSAERYRDALGRHFLAYIDDPYGVDRESGLPHLWHLATNAAFLCELDEEFKRKVAKTIMDEEEDGCCGCAFEDCTEDEYPCTSCCKNYMNMYERSK